MTKSKSEDHDIACVGGCRNQAGFLVYRKSPSASSNVLEKKGSAFRLCNTFIVELRSTTDRADHESYNISIVASYKEDLFVSKIASYKMVDSMRVSKVNITGSACSSPWKVDVEDGLLRYCLVRVYRDEYGYYMLQCYEEKVVLLGESSLPSFLAVQKIY